MKKTVFSLVLALAGSGLLATSCQDMLTPEMDRYATNFSGKDTANFYFGILKGLQEVTEQHLLLGELRGDLVAPTDYTSDSINDIINFRNLEDGENQLLNRAAYYKVINQCNFYLAKVDSMAQKNNKYYMRRELAQVQLVRAWTYLQLVQNYENVPFITRPVDNSNTGWESNPPEGWANADNLLELLEEKGGLSQAYNYSETLGYINYGSFNNGANNFNNALAVFNADLIYGDLYLLRSKGKSDYEKAAYHYHRYITDERTRTMIGSSERATIALDIRTRGKDEKYYSTTSDWRDLVSENNFGGVNEYRTVIPTAANKSFGLLLSRIPQIYGYDVESRSASSSSTSTSNTGENTTTVTATGAVRLTANYKKRQVEPSLSYLSLNQNQFTIFNEWEEGLSLPKEVKYTKLADARLHASAPMVETEKGRIRFLAKQVTDAPTGSENWAGVRTMGFRYGLPIYRRRQIYLRYAEAINRAGYPHHAFAILRDGLSATNLPKFINILEPKEDTIFVDPITRTDIDSIKRVARWGIDTAIGKSKSVTFDELYVAQTKSWLDFSQIVGRAGGIRAAGAGVFTDKDTLWVYNKVVPQRIKDEAARRGGSATIAAAEKVGITPDSVFYTNTNRTYAGQVDRYVVETTISPREYYGATEQEIAAVESLIADELALETAFEGTRYYDLMRIARHRNHAGEDGSSWLAWLISRRNENLKPYENPTQTGALFGFLNNVKNWYLPNPVVK